MPNATGRVDAARAVVFAPLDGTGRAELVEQRLTDAIVSGVLRDGERLPSESDLSRSLGVALVTAREALEGMRDKGMVRTQRGRDGGSFVTFDRESAGRMLEARLRGHSRIELRDLTLHVGAIAGTAAEVAADRASEDDLETLVAIDEQADLTTAGGARRAVSRFQLEVAAVSQSPRLVHEEIRLQGEAGPLLWLCLREQEYRDRSRAARLRVIRAIRDVDPAAARSETIAHVTGAFEWLIDERARLDATAGAAGIRREQKGIRMSITITRTAAEVADAIAETFDGIFATIDAWRERLEGALAAGTLTAAFVDPIVESFAVPVLEADALITGAGFVAAPGALADAEWHLAWWLQGPDELRRLATIDDPAHEQFRDYTALEWWRVPARTGARHLTGPYVDYVCTDDYAVTITTPVLHAGRMVGVVGTDALVDRLESELLPLLRSSGAAATIVNASGRVVTSTDARREPGSLLRLDGLADALGAQRAGQTDPHPLPGGATLIACGDTSLRLVAGA